MIAIEIYNFCIKYTNSELFIAKSQAEIKRAQKDFNNIICKVSELYTGSKEI